MLGAAEDEEAGMVVWVNHAPYRSADFDDHYHSMRSYASRWQARRNILGVLVVESGAPPPDARHRKRMADLVATFPPSWSGALVSPSALVRGTIVAMRWLRILPFELHAAQDLTALAERLGRDARRLHHLAAQAAIAELT